MEGLRIGPFSDAITIVWILYRERGFTCSFGGYKSKIGQLHLSSPHSGHEFTVTESHAEEIERKLEPGFALFIMTKSCENQSVSCENYINPFIGQLPNGLIVSC